MKNKNNRGFMLTETLVVASLLITVLLIIYIQFKNVSRNYTNSFLYNTVGSSYNLNVLRKYIHEEDYSLLANALSDRDYIDITDCSYLYFEDPGFCRYLVNSLNIKQVLFTAEDLQKIKNSNNLSLDFKDYINTIKYESVIGYRLVAAFNDGTFSSIKVLNGNEYDFVISDSCTSSILIDYKISHIDGNTGLPVDAVTASKASCGTELDITSKKTSNKCYFIDGIENFVNPGSNYFSLNSIKKDYKATISYDIYESVIEIMHYEEGTTLPVVTSDLLYGTCGDVIDVENYKKASSELPAGYNYVGASVDVTKPFTFGPNNITIILYYSMGA